MHEFSIAISIIESVEKEAKVANAESISSVTLDIGTMAGIEYYALDTAMEMAVKDTMLQDCEIVVNKIQAHAVCSDCGHDFEIENAVDQCPKCSSFFNEIISGKELKIKSIVIEENG